MTRSIIVLADIASPKNRALKARLGFVSPRLTWHTAETKICRL
jgi:hypothetical protein